MWVFGALVCTALTKEIRWLISNRNLFPTVLEIGYVNPAELDSSEVPLLVYIVGL